MTTQTQTKAKNEVQGDGVIQGVIAVPLSDVIADESFNARKSYNGESHASKRDSRGSIEDLAESLKRDGQLQPVLVTPDGKGKFFLRFGFRRFKAMSLLAEKNVAPPGFSKPGYIKVQAWEGSEKDAMLINLAENCARNDLLPWEIADRCVEISKAHSMRGDEIAVRIGKSKSHVNNLMRIASNVNPEILKAWQMGDGRATFDNLVKLAKTDPKTGKKLLSDGDQMVLWNEWGATPGDGDATPGDGAGSGKGKGKKGPSKRQIENAREALKECKDKSEDWRRGCKAALDFMLGATETLPGVYDPRKKTAKPVKEAKGGKGKASNGKN